VMAVVVRWALQRVSGIRRFPGGSPGQRAPANDR
jgi:hypothetical protein